MKADGEWLYELDAIEATDPYIEPNQAMMALIRGDVTLCGQLIQAHNANAKSISNVKMLDSQSSLSQKSVSDVNGGNVLSEVGPWGLVRRFHAHSEQQQGEEAQQQNAAKLCDTPFVMFAQ